MLEFLFKVMIMVNFINFSIAQICKDSTPVFMGKARFIGFMDWTLDASTLPDPQMQHEVIFAVKQKLDILELERMLLEVSDPNNIKYGKHLSREQVGILTANKEASNTVFSILNSNSDMKVGEVTTFGEYVTAKASVAVWEQLFGSKFRSFSGHGTNANRLEKIILILIVQMEILKIALTPIYSASGWTSTFFRAALQST